MTKKYLRAEMSEKDVCLQSINVPSVYVFSVGTPVKKVKKLQILPRWVLQVSQMTEDKLLCIRKEDKTSHNALSSFLLTIHDFAHRQDKRRVYK